MCDNSVCVGLHYSASLHIFFTCNKKFILFHLKSVSFDNVCIAFFCTILPLWVRFTTFFWLHCVCEENNNYYPSQILLKAIGLGEMKTISLSAVSSAGMASNSK